MNVYSEIISKQHDELEDKLVDLQNKADISVHSFEKRSAEISSDIEKMYNQMLAETEKKVREQNDSADSKMAEIRAAQSNFVLKMQDDSNLLQTHLSEIEKEIQEVKNNIQVFEKADKMKRQLEDNIQTLNNSFSKVSTFSDTADKMNSQYSSILKLNEEINRQVNNIEAQKGRVVTLEQQFSRMIALSNTIDERIASLNTTKDDLQAMEVTVRNYNDKLQYISEQYDRLDKKDEVVNRIKSDVDSQFEKLKELEQRLVNCNRQAVSLPNEIKEVQANVDKILNNGPKITDAIGRLESLDVLIADTEKRIDALNSVQSGIKKTELDLQGLSRDVDNKFKVLHQMTKQDMEKNPAQRGHTLNPQINDSVRQLKRQGWSISDIAHNLNLTENEVDLILQLPE